MIILGGSKRLATIFPARSIAISPGSGLLEPRTKSRVFQCNEQNKSFMFSPSRLMSSFPPGIRTAYPQYTVLGPENMLTVKLIMPGYRMARGNALIVDYKRKGRMLFEFTPRDSLGKFSYDDKAAMGLSVEEVGLLCNQLPQYEVEIVRNPSQYQDAEGGVGIAGGVVTSTASDVPLKSMKFSPGEGSSVRFILEDNSVDGNSQVSHYHSSYNFDAFSVTWCTY